jgi:HSP20 family protein
MSLIKYEPWSLLSQFSNELNRMFELPANRDEQNNVNSNVTASDWVPAVDIHEEDKHFVLHADIPGVDPKDIQVHMENGMLSISGERSHRSSEEREGYRRIERAHGTFLRRFTLPDTADAEKISATGKNGVLEIIIPKQEQTQPRKITVSDEE